MGPMLFSPSAVLWRTDLDGHFFAGAVTIWVGGFCYISTAGRFMMLLVYSVDEEILKSFDMHLRRCSRYSGDEETGGRRLVHSVSASTAISHLSGHFERDLVTRLPSQLCLPVTARLTCLD